MCALSCKKNKPNRDMKRRSFSSKTMVLGAVCLFLQASLLAPPLALGSEDSHARHHDVELEIARDKAAYVQKEFGNKAEIEWGQTVASDGFKTGYLRLTPKNFDTATGKTLVMIHGFSKDGTYWLDYVKAVRAIEMGYQIILPDLMVRGRTLDLNFPLNENGNWSPTDEMKKVFNDVTATREANYLLQMLKYLAPSQNNFSGGLGFLHHSRGSLVGAKLATAMGRDNIESHQKYGGAQPLPWNIFAYFNLNGFVSYTTASFLTLKNISFSPKETKNTNTMTFTQKETYNYIMSALEMLNLEYEIQLLRNQTVDENRDPQELASMLDAAKKLDDKLGAIKQSFLPYMEGVAENSFVDYVMKNVEGILIEAYPETKNLDGLKQREEAAMRAMMEGLRHLVKISVDKDGRQRYLSKMQMFPESVIGDFILFNHEGYPGLPKKIYNISGLKDTIVPPHLSRHIELATSVGKKPSTSQVVTRYMDITHYGPEEDELRKFTQKVLAQYSRMPIEALTITQENYANSGRKRNESIAASNKGLTSEQQVLKENKCSSFYKVKFVTRAQ